MAHFAELDNDNKVLRILVVNNNEILDSHLVEQEQKGIDFFKSLFGGNWIQTSYTARIRKSFAVVGGFYDVEKDAFIPIKPYPSWIFDEVDWRWKAPITKPVIEGKNYYWSEDDLSWREIPTN